MGASEAVSVQRSEVLQGRWAVIVPAVRRTRDRRLEQILISNAWQAAVLDDEVVVQEIDRDPGQPDRLV